MAGDLKVGENGRLISTDNKLELALETVRTNKAEAERFAQNPESYLKSKGVSTDGLHFGTTELSETELEAVSGGVAAATKTTICGSVGCIACVSVGN
jgi:hypothetical protein